MKGVEGENECTIKDSCLQVWYFASPGFHVFVEYSKGTNDLIRSWLFHGHSVVRMTNLLKATNQTDNRNYISCVEYDIFFGLASREWHHCRNIDIMSSSTVFLHHLSEYIEARKYAKRVFKKKDGLSNEPTTRLAPLETIVKKKVSIQDLEISRKLTLNVLIQTLHVLPIF